MSARPSACTRLSTPSGRPPARKRSVSASPSAGAYSAGFHTTVLPQSSAGTRYQAGTATGKLPAVIIATTPTGMRNVNSCLSGISLGTVWPYRRRPSERKKSQVSMISWTSPSDSAIGLADLARDEAGQRLLVVLDEASDELDRAAADGRRGGRPLGLRAPRRSARVHERFGVGQLDLGDHVVEIGGIAGLPAVSGGAGHAQRVADCREP